MVEGQLPSDERTDFNILSDHDYDGVLDWFKDAVAGEDEGNRKRSRVSNPDDEGWSIASKNRKSIHHSSNSNEVEEKVCVTSLSPLPKQFGLARLFKANNICGVTRVKYIHQLKMIVTFEAESNVREFLNCTSWKDLEWRCLKTSEVGTSYGVIKNIDLDVSEEEILKFLRCDVEVTEVKRLSMRKHNDNEGSGWAKCESVRLAFRGPCLPLHIHIDDMRIKVDPYIFPVTQCSRCWKFGHSRLLCPSKKVVCPKCTKNHENCETISFRCVNCTGSHMALQKVCPIFKKERRIRELMSESNCTYRQASSKFVPPPVTVSSGPSRENRLPRTPVELNTPRVRLMSELFSSAQPMSPSPEPSLEDCPFELVQGRKRQKKRKQSHSPSNGPSPAAVPRHMEAEELKDEPLPNIPKGSRSNGGSGDFGFMRLLLRLKEVIMSRETLQFKIRQIVSIIVEWLVSKLGGNLPVVGSIMGLILNNV